MTDLSGDNLGELLTEAQVVDRYPMVSARELKQARKSQSVRYLKANRTFYYHPDWVAGYLARKVEGPCPADPETASSDSPLENTGSTGSATPPAGPFLPAGTGTGMSPTDEESAAEVCAQKILGKRKSGSPRSS